MDSNARFIKILRLFFSGKKINIIQMEDSNQIENCVEEERYVKQSVAIGIDLGTTFSCVGAWNHTTGVVDIIENEEGSRTTPSVVGFDSNGRYIGQSAIRQQIRNPRNTVYEVKRLIGRNFREKIVQEDARQWPFEVIELGDDKPVVHIEYDNKNYISDSDDKNKKESKILQPEQISAMILEKLKDISQSHFGDTKIVTDAVITVPAYFNDGQKQATRDAGYIAGLNVLRIIPEPTAAALAYGLDEVAVQNEGDMNVLIYDLGGGTFDVSLLTFNKDDQIFEVRAISGDSHLGGADFDHRLVEYCARLFCSENNVEYSDLKASHRSMQKLRLSCERAKKVLSQVDVTSLEIDSLFKDIDFNPQITKNKFEDLCKDLFEKCMKPVDQVLYDAFISPNDVHEIVLVGGSTRIPKIQELLSTRFNGKKLCKDINPDEAVAYGAAIQAAILTTNPEDEDTNVPDIILLDVCPLSLGVELTGGLMSPIIQRNTTIPTSRSKMFSTSEDNQETVIIKIFEGERPETIHNRLLGTFELSGIELGPRGSPKIEVKFSLDADGILTVEAHDWATSSEQEDQTDGTIEGGTIKNTKQIVINNEKGRLTDEDINSMLEDAKEFREQDELFKKRIKAKTMFENYLFELRRILTEDKTFMSNCEESELSLLDSTFKKEWEWFSHVNKPEIYNSMNPETFIDRLENLQKEIVFPIIEAVNKRLSPPEEN